MEDYFKELNESVTKCTLFVPPVGRSEAMSAVQFKNDTTLVFDDISSEAWREYTFEGGDVVRIDEPLRLNVSENGHRIFDASGRSHYVPKTWIHLQWQPKDGAASFVR